MPMTRHMIKAAQLGITSEELIEAFAKSTWPDLNDFLIGYDNYHTTQFWRKPWNFKHIISSLRDNGKNAVVLCVQA